MSLYVEQHGDLCAPPMVLLHGWGMSSAIWQNWIPSLEQDFNLLLVDLPGLGRSRFDSDQPYSLELLAEQIFDRLSPQLDQPAVWLGWSLGGIAAAKIASKYPEQVAALITISTNPCFVQRPDWPQGMPATIFHSFQAALLDNPLKTLNRFSLLQGQGDPDPRNLLRILKSVIRDSAGGASNLDAALALLADDYRSLFAGLSVARLFLFAANDALVPAALSRSPLLSAHAQLIENTGHLPFISAQEMVSSLVSGWLKELSHG